MNEQILPNRQQFLSPHAIVTKIDMIIQELERLRAMVVKPPTFEQSDTDLADKLFGVLGNGTWSEYDPDLEWKRFDI